MTRRTTLLATALAAAALAAPAEAPGIVPPKDCGFTKVGGKRYNIKSDQMRCSTAVRYARAYLGRRSKPRGYRCRNYSGSALKFRCEKGVHTFFAIKR